MVSLTRRTLIKSSAAAAATVLLPRWSHASFAVGDWQIDTLSDGHLVLPTDFILGPMPTEEIAPILERHGVDPSAATIQAPLNITLLRGHDRVVLFDAGSGTAFQDTAGELPDALDALGVAPENVTDVVFTHGHPDHLWGVLDDFDDPFFAQARHVMGAVELNYWLDPATVDTIGSARQSFAAGASRRLEVLGDMVETISDGEEILPGVVGRLTAGHTPGHMSFEIHGGSDAVMIVGDAITNAHVGFEAPSLPSGSDQNQELAADARVTLLDRIAADKMLLIGYHLPAGGIGRAERMGDAYRFIPENDA